jgi:hypothetical protein
MVRRGSRRYGGASTEHPMATKGVPLIIGLAMLVLMTWLLFVEFVLPWLKAA